MTALRKYPLTLHHVCTRGSSRNPFYYNSRYVFQEERGEEGTPHLQGYLHYKNQVARSTLKQWNPRLHLEPARSITQSIEYCSDPTKRHGRIWAKHFAVREELGLISAEDFYTWQRELLAELLDRPHPRQIVWYFDSEGGSGKTAFARHVLGLYPGVLYLSGGTYKDASYQALKMKQDPRICLVNLPRSTEGKVSYGIFESLKDGLVQSGKYEGGVRLFAPPHVIIFANFLPDMASLSFDRWNIRHLRFNERIT